MGPFAVASHSGVLRCDRRVGHAAARVAQSMSSLEARRQRGRQAPAMRCDDDDGDDDDGVAMTTWFSCMKVRGPGVMALPVTITTK